MNRTELKQLRTNLALQVDIYKGRDTLWHWTSVIFGTHSGFTTKGEAEQDFQAFLKRDLNAEANMKSRGKGVGIKLAMKERAPKARKDYPDELLATAYQLYEECKVIKTCAVNACRFAIESNMITEEEVEQKGIAKMIAIDMSFYNKQRQSAAVI